VTDQQQMTSTAAQVGGRYAVLGAGSATRLNQTIHQQMESSQPW
jgi:hypothetical protein